jgi:hypothetical protein
MIEVIYKLIMLKAINSAKTSEQAYIEAIIIELIAIAILLIIAYLIIKQAVKNGIKAAKDDIKERPLYSMSEEELNKYFSENKDLHQKKDSTVNENDKK